jgi:hypothetical protein
VHDGIVENIHFPGKIKQMAAYREGLKKAKWETEWLAIIDLDEFLYPIKENTVPHVLQKFETYSWLVVHWKTFGSSWLIERPPNQIHYFLRRAQKDFELNKYIKSIVKPEYVNTILVYDPHFCFYNEGFSVDENYKKVVNSPENTITMNDICINHYWVRSYQDWIWVKQITGRADVNLWRDANEFAYRDRNDVFDDELSQRFWNKLW